MKKLFFAAALAIVAVSSALAVNYKDSTGRIIICDDTKQLQCSDYPGGLFDPATGNPVTPGPNELYNP